MYTYTYVAPCPGCDHGMITQMKISKLQVNYPDRLIRFIVLTNAHRWLPSVVKFTMHPVVAISVDGLNWQYTEPAMFRNVLPPALEETMWTPLRQGLPKEPKRRLLVQLLESDLLLRIHVLSATPSSQSDCRSERFVIGKLHLPLHDIAEGETLEAWFPLVVPESNTLDIFDLKPYAARLRQRLCFQNQIKHFQGTLNLKGS